MDLQENRHDCSAGIEHHLLNRYNNVIQRILSSCHISKRQMQRKSHAQVFLSYIQNIQRHKLTFLICERIFRDSNRHSHRGLFVCAMAYIVRCFSNWAIAFFDCKSINIPVTSSGNKIL